MPYTKEEGGLLNNFAVEPKVYTAEPPSQAQVRNYLIFGGLGIALLGGLVYVAVAVS